MAPARLPLRRLLSQSQGRAAAAAVSPVSITSGQGNLEARQGLLCVGHRGTASRPGGLQYT